ncbi:sensor histidine kinase [Plantactinospora sp. GCM10030261]|uniref:sensor histidine kinase n=1 Tax=Plantactinospora sp. GCM10030261 TaxID=3273420 RepID=UPI00360F2154
MPMPSLPAPLRAFSLWEVYFGAAAGTTMVLVAATGSEPVAARAWALAALAGLAGWYVGYGRRLIMNEIEDRRAYVYFAGVVVLFVPAVLLVDSSSYALMALCPQPFFLMPTLRATAVVLVLNGLDVAAAYLDIRDWGETVRGPLPVSIMVVVGTAVFGSWARSVSAQNDERARLIDQLNGSRTEVARLSHEAGVLAERQRLAGEMHDTVAQGLTSIIMLIQAADADAARDVDQARRHLALALATARDNLAEARAFVGALTPADLTGSSLPEALHRLVDRFGQETSVPATFGAAGMVERLPTAVEVVLLRAVQESLANVRKHAGANRVAVRLERTAAAVSVTVTDDGRGFAPDQPSSGYGLSAMRARVEQVSGTVCVDSAPNRGTTVRVEVPCQ